MEKQLVFSNADLSRNSIITIQAQYLCRFSPFEEVVLTPELIAYYIHGANVTKDQIAAIRKELNSCTLCEKLATNYFRFKKDVFNLNSDFEKLDVDVFELLMNAKVNNKPALLEHLYQIIKSISGGTEIRGKNKVVGFMPIDYFAKNENVSESTIIRYNKQLEELGILYIVHGGYISSKGKKYNNIYGLAKNKAHIDAYAETLGVTGAKNNRSISVKYNWFIKNPGKYNRAEIRELCNECEKYNQANEYNKKNTYVLQKCSETDNVFLRIYYLYNGGLIELLPQVVDDLIQKLNEENIYPCNDDCVVLTAVQREKVELGLATPQDFFM